jgi:hypothetical protein
MKKYIIMSLVCFSFASVASDKVKLGQLDGSTGQNDCNAPHVVACGPCYKLCVEQNKSDRGAKGDTASGAKKAPSRSGSQNTTRQ